MKSPIDEKVSLQRDELEPGFTVHRCPISQGVWIPPQHYWQWLDKQAAHANQSTTSPTDAMPVSPEALPIEDSPAGKHCPSDGAFLIRHRVGHGVPFCLDRCGHCGGVWLDANEWETLKQHQLHDRMHLVFTAAWQARVRQQDQAKASERLLREHLGEADYDKACQIKDWLDTHAKKPMLLAFWEDAFNQNKTSQP